MKYSRGKILRWVLPIAAIAGLVVFFPKHFRPASSQPVPLASTAIKAVSGLPVRIKIPSIGVDAVIEHLAQTSDGFMDTPKFPSDTGWYELGPRPGEKGSAVIDGHVDWNKGARAVFADLQNLKPGDKVSVLDDQGVPIFFKVLYSREYGSHADARDIFISTDGKSRLNLITCSGVWDTAANGYSQRLVVFTEKE